MASSETKIKFVESSEKKKKKKNKNARMKPICSHLPF